MTRPHVNRLADVGSGENGAYSLKVGRRAPHDSVNLAYVSSPKISINENVSLIDRTNDIIENVSSRSTTSEIIMASNDDFLLLDKYNRGSLENNNILITDEFSMYKNKVEDIKPLYYMVKLPGYFYTDDIKSLAVYVPGYNPYPVELDRNLDFSSPLLYTGSKIEITQKDGTKLNDSKAFKIKLVTSLSDNIHVNDRSKVFEVYIYTNFKNSNGNTYIIRYPSYDVSTRRVTEGSTCILSAAPVFSEKDISYIQGILNNPTDESLQESVYAVQSNGDYYNVYAPSKMITATQNSRPATTFRYKILANIKGKYDEFNPHTVKIGVIYEENQPEGENISDILCGSLNKGDISLPDYISLENPHPMGNYYRYDPRYWKVDLNMSREFMLDYDVIILTGYGTADLSIYADKFHAFLNNGGKLIVDNLTNSATGRFYPNINNSSYTIMDIGCSPTGSVIDGVIQAGADTSVFSEYYTIDISLYNSVRYSENDVLVSSEVTFGVNDSVENWTSVLRYGDGRPAMLYKKYNGRGTILFSNFGLLRKYRSSTSPGAEARLLTNIIVQFARDLYITTPWIYDHVYHRDNLFGQEYVVNGKTVYVDDVSSFNTVIAKKILAPTTRSAVLPYITPNLYSAPGLFYIQYESQDNIQMTSTNDGSETLYVYAIDPKPYSYTPIEAGYKDGDIKIINEAVEFQYTIRAFTYRWEDLNGIAVFNRQDGPSITHTKTISRSDGIMNLGPLVAQLPPLPKGEVWADTSKIFFELVFTLNDSGAVHAADSKVNIGIYDKRIGQYYYNNNAQNIIPYNYLYEYRNIVTENPDGTTSETPSVIANDLIVQAWTNYYTISAKARTFAVRVMDDKGKIYLELPRYTDEREQWHVKIHNGGFKKTRYTQNDYINYVKLMKYRYGNSEVMPIIEAPVFPNVTLEYSTDAQFDQQSFINPKPFKRSVEERAEFINEFTIGVNNKPLYINSFSVINETLVQVDANSYKSNNASWLESGDVVVRGESSLNTFVVIDPNLYEVDYKLGIVNFIAEFDTDYTDSGGNIIHMPAYLSVTASYTCANIQVVKRKYTNQLIRGELLKRQSDNKTLIVSNRNIAAYPTPTLYSNDEIYPNNQYTIDYKNGVIKMYDAINENLYLDYTYYNDDVLTPSDYDVENGYIYLVEQIDFTDEIYATYVYEEEFVHYNGYYDGTIYYHLDLNPSEGHVVTYKVADQNGNETYKLVPTIQVINKPIFIYLLPYKQTSLTTGITTTYNNCIRHCFGEEEMARLQYMIPEAVIIGVVQIRENSKVEDSVVLDTRVRGGGIRTSITDRDIDNTQPLARHYWDISTWDGIGYQSNGVIVIRLPKTVLKENGGAKTKSEIDEIVRKYAAYGTYQIIEYY